ncbi:hypothetical protein OG799_04155 [Micromonospora sp. NBC_00898]|uniref:hypothetical protein n=1 Tax=Micromonospora sp. NBC_00898 TaxID=2975981 RepID=UPI00386CDCE5|nr:hypothetical protein OG799_04155 [Micromonospora sp. NBC_00898]
MDARIRVAAALTLTLAVTGCAAGAQPTSAKPSTSSPVVSRGPVGMVAPVPPPTQPGFSYADAEQVCRRFVIALYSADTRRDSGPGDAYQRAVRFASSTLAGHSAAADRDRRWATWAGHRVHLDTVVEPFADLPQPGDSAIAARRTIRVTATAVGEDGWRGWTQHSVIDCALRRGGPDGPGWRVSGCEIRQAGLR